MKTIYAIIGAMLIMAVGASAIVVEKECIDYGFDYGIVKFEWNGNEFVPVDTDTVPFGIVVTGSPQEAHWTSTEQVAGVIRKASTEYTVLDGGVSGTVYGFTDDNKNGRVVVHDISNLAFCANEPTHGVPEFPAGTIAVAAVLGTIGVMVVRKK